MKYSCYIIDDEPLAIDVIIEHLKKLSHFEVKGSFTDPLKAFEKIKTEKIDLVFLDIEMPELDGLSFINILKTKPDIIITTAYREYAVEGFELNVLDYLVKPIPFPRFLNALEKFLEKRQAPEKTPSKQTDSYIIIKSDRKSVKVNLSDILYIEGLKDYVKIILPNEELLTKESLGNFYKKLDQGAFIRIHKSFIVSKQHITAYTAHHLEIEKIQIPVGRSYKNEYLSLVHDIEKHL